MKELIIIGKNQKALTVIALKEIKNVFQIAVNYQYPLIAEKKDIIAAMLNQS